MRKIVFLDIDGVLNHQLHYTEKRQCVRNKEEGFPAGDISQSSVDILNGLCDIEGIEFVLSSTWRMGQSLEVRKILKDKGFRGTLIDDTPISEHRCRGLEIQTWLDWQDNKDDISFIILDDDSDMLLNQATNFIKIDGYCGITPNNVYVGMRKLNGLDNRIVTSLDAM